MKQLRNHKAILCLSIVGAILFSLSQTLFAGTKTWNADDGNTAGGTSYMPSTSYDVDNAGPGSVTFSYKNPGGVVTDSVTVASNDSGSFSTGPAGGTVCFEDVVDGFGSQGTVCCTGA